MSHVWAIEPTHLTRAMGEALTASDGDAPEGYTVNGSEAVIAISDMITPTPMFGWFGPMGTACSTLLTAIAAAKGNANITSVAFAVNSPGGIVSGVREVMQAIRDIGKPTTARIDGLCCSAAYWMASAADTMVATVTSTVGSLGVMKPVGKGPQGLKLFRSSDSPAKCAEPDSEEADQYQVIVDDFAAVMFDDIATNRGVKREGLAAAYGAGAILPARKAISMGLIDGLTDAANSPNPGVRANDTSPALAGMEAPMAGNTDPAEMSREDLEAEVRKLRGDDTQDEEVAADDNGGAPGEEPEEEKEAPMAAASAAASAAVSSDIELNRLKAELAKAKSQLSVQQLHAAQAQAQVKTRRVDALIKSGRVGTTDAHRKMAERAYDAEMASAEQYAAEKGCDLATALKACPVREFSELEGAPAGSGNPSLATTSVGGSGTNSTTAKDAIVADIYAKAKENKTTYAVELAAWREANPGDYAAHFGGAK